MAEAKAENAMKFGLFVNNQQPRDTDPVLNFRQCVQQVIAARDCGFDAIASGHHYVSPPYIALQNLPFLARLAADAGEMDLVLAVTLLALLNPVQTAEEIASLDVMSGGRVVFGVGIGYREEEFQAFGLQVSDRVPRMLEGLRLIKRLWTEDIGARQNGGAASAYRAIEGIGATPEDFMKMALDATRNLLLRAEMAIAAKDKVAKAQALSSAGSIVEFMLGLSGAAPGTLSECLASV
jgi:alkanesulfonate monooxygenase SsuD/methylene tetrahydromethanopterin reductase-like flavin-dependent oxidoreductase (luciferase family)